MGLKVCATTLGVKIKFLIAHEFRMKSKPKARCYTHLDCPMIIVAKFHT